MLGFFFHFLVIGLHYVCQDFCRKKMLKIDCIAKEFNCIHSRYMPGFSVMLNILEEILGLGKINSDFFPPRYQHLNLSYCNSKLIYTR